MQHILSELTLIIPTKNDHKNIIDNFVKIQKYLTTKIKHHEILLISNGSNEASVRILDTFCTTNKNVSHIISQKQGKGVAVKIGIQNSKYKNILFSDADSSVEIIEFDKFVLNQKLITPFVIGNRKNKLSQNLKTPKSRLLTGFLFNKLVNYLFNINIQDTQCGFKAMDKSIFIDCDNFVTEGFSFDIEIILLALKNKIDITEIPVKYIHDLNSNIHIFSDSVKMLKQLIKLKNQKLEMFE